MVNLIARLFNPHPQEKSTILVIGGKSRIRDSIVKASLKAGHITYVLIEDKNMTMDDWWTKSKEIHFYGDFKDYDFLLKAIKLADVVISTITNDEHQIQDWIIAAIREAGNVKRFYPAEFGSDVRHTHAVDPAKTEFQIKARIRRVIEARKIPHTYISSNCFADDYLPRLAQPGTKDRPRDKVVILGGGNTKAVFNAVEDIGTYTIKTVDDPRTLNKVVYIKPPGNIYSVNELITLWEKMTKKRISQKVYLSELEVLEKIRESPHPLKMDWAMCHSIFVKGNQTNFEIDPSFGVEASALYPNVKYTTVAKYINSLM